MEGFKRDPSKEVERKPRKRVFGKVKKKEIDRAVPPPMREQIARAIMALGFREVYAHDIQGEITRWIRNHFGSVNPETVQRRWRDLGLQRGHPAHARGEPLPRGDPERPGLRSSGRRRRHRSQRHAHLRGRADRDPRLSMVERDDTHGPAVPARRVFA